jgi:hypothetical protein
MKELIKALGEKVIGPLFCYGLMLAIVVNISIGIIKLLAIAPLWGQIGIILFLIVNAIPAIFNRD